MHVDISVELSADPGSPVAFKFACDLFELNVRVPQSELGALGAAAHRSWVTGSLRAGASAESPVFWSAGEPGRVAIMVGPDDETWDFSVEVPAASLAQALQDAERLVCRSREV